MTTFNHLNVPTYWQQYYTKYPEGYTILEALLNWVQQVDNMVDNVNDWNTYLNEFKLSFDTNLQATVENTLNEWKTSGFLTWVINDALKTQEYILTTELATTNQNVATNTANIAGNTQQIAANTAAINGIGNLKFIGIYTTLSDLQTAYPTGTNGVALISADGYGYYWNGSAWAKGMLFQSTGIAAGSIVASQLATNFFNRVNVLNNQQKILASILFDSPQTNLFNKNTVTMDFYLINGVPTASAGNCYSDFIPVIPSSTIWATRFLSSDAGSFYDINQTLISKFSVASGNTAPVPSNAYYVRVNISPSVNPLSGFMIVQGAAAPTGYSDHRSGTINGLKIPSDHILGTIYPEQLADMEILNLYDGATSTPNTYIDNTGKVAASTIIDLSRYIKVSAGEYIGCNFSYLQQGCFLTGEKNFLQQITLAETSTGSGWFTQQVPTGAEFIRVNAVHNDLPNFMLTKSTSKPVGYTSYRLTPKWMKTYDNYVLGKKGLAIGDSITWLDGTTDASRNNGVTVIGYQQVLRDAGALITSMGDSGATYRKYVAGISDQMHGSIYDDIVTNNYDLSPYDFITLFGGTNDVGRGLNLGTIGLDTDTTFDPNTTYGALRGIIEYIQTHNPDCEIYVATPIRSGLSSRPTASMEQITTGIISIAQMYSLPVIDLLHESGIGKLTYTTYLYDSLHPNNVGMALIGKKMLKTINGK